ncbi:type II toxin-antitoxin system PemK/MazF family toxin [Rickettsia conorii subsp. raoultii]
MVVDFNLLLGGEVAKVRPAIIISNNYSNASLNHVQVIPLTSNIDKCYPCEVYVMIGSKKGKAMTDQIMTVSKI